MKRSGLGGITGLFVLALGCGWIAGCGGAGTSSHATGAGGSAGSGDSTGGTTSSAGSTGSGGSNSSPGGATSTAGSTGSGGSSSGDGCGSFIPCGGDLLGTWHVARFCIATETAEGIPTAVAACAGMYTGTGVTDENASMTFSDNGTLERATLPGITLSSWTYTLECLSGSGDRTILPEDMPAECASLALEGDIAGGHLDRSCAMGDAGCVCDSTFTVESAYSQSYDYATTGADLMIGTNRYQYCVEGDTLKYGFEGGGDYEVYTR